MDVASDCIHGRTGGMKALTGRDQTVCVVIFGRKTCVGYPGEGKHETEILKRGYERFASKRALVDRVDRVTCKSFYVSVCGYAIKNVRHFVRYAAKTVPFHDM